MKRALWVAMLAGCGATTTPAAPSPDCGPVTERAGSAWARVADLGEGSMATESGPTPIDAAITRLQAHLASLEESPTEVDGEVALEISGLVMDALDGLGPDVPAPLRDRCDTAAEALLTDRTAAGSQAAASGAVAALEAALTASRPDESADRGVTQALARLVHRARNASDGYAEEARIGDRRAVRAEATELPEAAPSEVVDARAEAVESSREARETCGFSRALSAPSL